VGSLRDEALPFAQQVLMRLFCREKKRPCGACPGCRQVLERRHADIVWIEPEKKSRVVGIDRVRDLQRVVYQTSFEGGWKAVVLVSADRVGEEASNALLKTLEEPPPRCLFLLLTDTPQAVMATIASRCQRIVLSSEAEALPEPWRSELLGILGDPVPSDLSGALLRSGRLEKLLAALRKTIADEEEAAAEAAEGGDIDSDTMLARIEARYRGLRTMIVRGILMWYRDILLCVCGVGPEALHHPEREADLRRMAAGVDYGGALRNLQAIEAMQRQFDRNMASEGVLQGAFGAMSA
jgi:DNA polymerase-3 subunit delta'